MSRNDIDRTQTLTPADPDATTAPVADAADTCTELTGIGRVGPYVLLEPLRSWRDGTVYRAVHAELRRTVDLQLLNPETPAERRAAFLDDIRRAAAVESPFVAKDVREVGVAEGTTFVARDPAVGPVIEDFRPHERGRRELLFPNDRLAELVRDSAAGLAAIHACGLTHGAVSADRLRRDSSVRARWHGLGEPAPGDRDDLRDWALAIGEILTRPGTVLRPDRWAADLLRANPGVSRQLVRRLDDARTGRAKLAGELEAAAAKLARQKLVPASWADRGFCKMADGFAAIIVVGLTMILVTANSRMSNTDANWIFLTGMLG